MPFVEHQGAHIVYKSDGNGPALILVHGTGGNADTNWAAMIDGFTEDRTVLRPDYSGSGGTTDDGRDLTSVYLARQVLAVADDAGADRFSLFGFSLGAAIAAQIAADYPERVQALILLAGFPSAKDARLQMQFDLWQELIESDRTVLARLMLLTGFTPDAASRLGADGLEQAVEDTLNDVDWEGMARHVELDLRIDVSPSIARITAPTLVIGCTHDHMVPPSHARALAEEIADARYAELQSGHLAPMEQPEKLIELVTAFLRDCAE